MHLSLSHTHTLPPSLILLLSLFFPPFLFRFFLSHDLFPFCFSLLLSVFEYVFTSLFVKRKISCPLINTPNNYSMCKNENSKRVELIRRKRKKLLENRNWSCACGHAAECTEQNMVPRRMCGSENRR